MFAWVNAHALWPNLPVWIYMLVALIDTHITTASVTLYLHRCQTHRSTAFHPLVEHFMRFWLWVRNGDANQRVGGCSRCHHAHVHTDEDPHSPYPVE